MYDIIIPSPARTETNKFDGGYLYCAIDITHVGFVDYAKMYMIPFTFCPKKLE